MKIKQNQQFTTLDFLGLILSCLTVVAVIAPIMKQAIGADEAVKAQLETEDLAHSLLQKNFKMLGVEDPAGRQPANFVLSKTLNQIDPWGNPYRYKLAKNEKGNPIYLVVWSAGPNGSSESDDVEVNITINGTPEAAFQGDDTGSVLSIR